MSYKLDSLTVGHDLNNLEQIVNLCQQGVQTGIGFERGKR